jgi:hypothetical protein
MFLLMATGASHANVAITFTSHSNFNNGNEYTLGFEFSPNETISVTDLGSYFPSGATDAHGVTVFDTSGVILASTTVTGTGTEGFDFTPIAPLTLTAGTDYIIGANTVADDWAYPVTFTVDSAINYIGHVETSRGGVTPCFPGPAAGLPDDFGANFKFSVVPEPSTWAMMLLGFAGLGYAGYRRSRRARIDALA